MEVEVTFEDQDFSLVPLEGCNFTRDNLAKRNWPGVRSVVTVIMVK
jgi:hypothetical protein